MIKKITTPKKVGRKSAKSTFATLLKNRNSIFTSITIKSGDNHRISNINSSYIVCFSSGELTVYCDKYGVRNFVGGDMIVIPRCSNFRVTGIAPSTQVLLINCTEFSKEHECKLQTDGYIRYRNEIDYNFIPTRLKPALRICIESIHRYKESRVKCDKIYLLKLLELAACIENYYAKNEIAYLFYPIIERDLDFRRFVIANYDQAMTVKDLVDMSNMCRTVFYEKFIQEFGMTAKQWMLKQKILAIEKMLSDPKVRIKDIIQNLDFPSHEHFHSFCRRHFQCKPSDLRRKLISEDEIEN